MKEDVLPEGWEYKSILSLIPKDGIISDGDWIESKDQDVNGDVRLIQLADIGDGEFKNKSRRYLTSEKAKELNCTYLKPNDILIARMPDPIGRACVFPEIGQKSVTAVDICIIRLGERPVILAELLVYWVNSSFIRNQMNSEATGTTRKRITRKKLEQFKIPLPPLPEQQYLSQKLTALLDEVAQTKQRLEAIPALLKQFRQSVLADAVSGRLTEEWREENEAILTVDDLTKKLNSFKSKTKNLDPLIQNNKWVSCQLGHLLTVKSGDGLTAKQMIDGEIPVYGGNGINGFHNQFNVEQPTIVIGRVGFYCGSVHLTEEKSWITDNALIVNFYSEVITQGFIYYLLKHLNLGRLSSSTAQPVVSGSKIYSVRINLPTLKEQTQIVQKVETYFALASEIETQVNTALENVNLLTQSILAKAFSGELSAAWRNSQVTETQGNV